MYKLYLYKISLCLYGAGLIAIGIAVLAQGHVLLQPAAIIGGVVLSFHGAHLLLKYFFKRQETINQSASLLAGLFNLGMGILVIIMHTFTVGLLIAAFTVYVFMNAIVKLTDFLLLSANKIKGSFFALVAFIFYTVFGVLMVFVPNMGQQSFLIVSGIYCILYGVCVVNDFIAFILPKKAKNVLKRKIRITLPVFISTFIPLRLLRSFNSFVQPETENQDEYVFESSLKEGEKPDIEILIHVSEKGYGRFGHCDICLDGTILSYGNYDRKSFKFKGGIGDGILFEVDKKTYLEYCVDYRKKTLFSFGLKLNEEQLNQVKEEIKRIKSTAVPWKPPYQVALENGEDVKLEDFKDYCSAMWAKTKAKYYKCTEGRFKTYFIMTTNCVLLTDSIVGKAGADIVRFNGIITPGAYFDYLQREYLIPGSMVISREVYR